jgi:glycosyltransferase involved in cell wall biosynthesis
MNDTAREPLVSVIVPVRNGERFLATAIESIIAQSYRHLEIIVVDGQSSDGTANIAKSYQRVRYLYQSNDLGIAAARNLGIAAARGDLIAFISHDDIWEPEKLDLQMGYMTRNPEMQYTITRVNFFVEPGVSLPPGFRAQLLQGDHIGRMPETLLARKSLFELIGVFDSQFEVGEDNDWFSRAADRRIPSGLVEKVLVHKRVHDSNFSLGSTSIHAFNSDMLKIAKRSIARKRGGISESGEPWQT